MQWSPISPDSTGLLKFQIISLKQVHNLPDPLVFLLAQLRLLLIVQLLELVVLLQTSLLNFNYFLYCFFTVS